MEKTKLLTPRQYGESLPKSCTAKNVIKKIKNGNISKDTNVVSVNKYGRFYLIEVLVG